MFMLLLQGVRRLRRRRRRIQLHGQRHQRAAQRRNLLGHGFERAALPRHLVSARNSKNVVDWLRWSP